MNKLSKIALMTSLILLTLFITGLTLPSVEASPKDLEKGNALLVKGKFSKAVKAYQKALQENPSDVYAQLGLGQALKGQGQLDRAQVVLENLTRSNPNFAPAHCNLGDIHEAKGNTAKARASYTKYVKLSGSNIPPSPELRLKLRKLGVL